MSDPKSVIITSESHPLTFKALREIDLDNGMINRLEPAKESYEIPYPYTQILEATEEALAVLSPADFNTFCCGANEDIEVIKGTYGLMNSYLVLAYNLLNAYFVGWLDEQDSDRCPCPYAQALANSKQSEYSLNMPQGGSVKVSLDKGSVEAITPAPPYDPAD